MEKLYAPSAKLIGQANIEENDMNDKKEIGI
jgi:hypothetical protein